MATVTSIGEVPWSREALSAKLKEFAALYERRPIADNAGGMRSPQMFLAWFALQALRPATIVESGVWLGQGTWFFEQACPDAALFCLDPKPGRIRYRSTRAQYLTEDFTAHDWSGVAKDRSVLFFDDHQDAYERVRAARGLGFQQLIFEDNYPPGLGDCRSLKQILAGADPGPRSSRSWTARLRRGLGRLLAPARPDASASGADTESRLRECLEVYYEFPPIFKPERTRWGDRWEESRYPTPEPLLTRVEAEYQRRFADEAANYTWLCYARLRGS